MTIWNGLTSEGAVVPIQVDDQGRVIAIGSGPDSPLVVDGDFLRPRDETKGLGTASIDLDASGGATFAGLVQVGPNATASDNPGIQVGSPSRRGFFEGFCSASEAGAASLLTNNVEGDSKVVIKHDGRARFEGQLDIVSDNRSGYSIQTTSVQGLNGYNIGQTSSQGSFYLVQQADGIGVYLPTSATAWSPVGSAEDTKDIVPMTVDNSWDVIRDIELFNYYYKVNDEQHRATHPPYFGPMARRLGKQDPDLLIDNDGACTYNAALLEMKALSALSTALNRIEALEAEVKNSKADDSTTSDAAPMSDA